MQTNMAVPTERASPESDSRRASGPPGSCPRIDALERGGPEVVEHLATCRRCRSIADLLNMAGAQNPPHPQPPGDSPTAPLLIADACARAGSLIAARVRRPLWQEADSFLAAHLADCPPCRAVALEPPSAGERQLPEVAPDSYVIGGEIGHGGMGRVLSARDVRIGRAVALKEMLAADPEARLRFEREARLTARLQHPGIVSVYEVGCWPDGRPFYAMPILTGRTLFEAIEAARGPRERLHLLPSLIAAADAVAYAHSRRIIHRDLKPANILLGSFGETVVIDWGIAKELDEADEMGAPMGGAPMAESGGAGLTRIGQAIGTPGYIAPEQAAGQPVDERSDVYALGAILYQLLTGKRPFHGLDAYTILAELAAGKAPAPITVGPDTPADLASVAEKAMAREPSQRYASAADLVEDLRLYQTGQPVGAHAYTRREQASRWLTRRLTLVVGTAVTLGLVAIASIAGGVRVSRERRRAETTTASLLVEQGRQEALAGRSARALAYLDEAHRRGNRSAMLRFLLASVERSTGAERPFDSPWERSTKKATYSVVFSPITDVAFRPDGRILAIAQMLPADFSWAGAVVILEVPGGREVRRLDDWRHPLHHVAFVGDGSRLVTWGVPGSPTPGATLWDAASGTALRVLAPERELTGLELDRAGRLALITGDDDRGVEIWDLQTGVKWRTFAGRRAGDRLQGRFLSDARQIVTFGIHEPPTVRDLETAQIRLTLPEPAALATLLAVSHDGKRAATAGTAGARLWDLETGRLLSELVSGSVVREIAFNRDGSFVLLGSRDGATSIFSVADGTRVATLRSVSPIELATSGGMRAAFTPDGTRVVAARAGELRAWHARTGLPLESYDESDRVRSMFFSPDSRWMLTSDNRGSGRLWDLRGSALVGAVTGVEVAPVESNSDGLRGLAGKQILTSRSGELELRDRQGVRAPASERFAGTRLLALSADRRAALVLRQPAQAELRSTTTGDVLITIAPLRPVAVAAVSPDASLVLTSDRAGGVYLWDGHTGRQLRAFDGFGHELEEIVFSHDGRRLYLQATGAEQGSLWDPQHGQKIVSLEVGQHSSAVFSPDGRLLAVSNHLRVFRAEDGLFQYGLGLPSAEVSFSRDSAYLVARGDSLRVIDAQAGRPLVEVPTPDTTGALFAADSSLLITVGRDETTVMDWRTQRPVVRYPGNGVARRPEDLIGSRSSELPPALELSADGRVLAVNRAGGAVDLWAVDLDGRGPPRRAQEQQQPALKLVDGILVQTRLFLQSKWRAAPSRPAENLDFEAGLVGQPAPGWVEADSKPVVMTSDDQPHRGKLCGLLSPDPADAATTRIVDARPYRSKLVRVRAAFRCDPGTRAHFAASTFRPAADSGPARMLRDASLCVGGWTSVELLKYVDRDAATVSFGVGRLGPGKIWVDDFSLEVVSGTEGSAGGRPR
jgi:eukaryotic-like serine/threonine-protein kinase